MRQLSANLLLLFLSACGSKVDTVQLLLRATDHIGTPVSEVRLGFVEAASRSDGGATTTKESSKTTKEAFTDSMGEVAVTVTKTYMNLDWGKEAVQGWGGP